VAEVAGADGSTWCMVSVDGAWRHVDPAAAQGAPDASWLMLTDEELVQVAPDASPWALVDGGEAPKAEAANEQLAADNTDVADEQQATTADGLQDGFTDGQQQNGANAGNNTVDAEADDQQQNGDGIGNSPADADGKNADADEQQAEADDQRTDADDQQAGAEDGPAPAATESQEEAPEAASPVAEPAATESADVLDAGKQNDGAQDPASKKTVAGSSSKSLAQTLNEKSGITAQAVSERTLTLNGQWHDFYPTGHGTANGCIYTFSIPKTSLVQLGFQNWWSNYSQWELYNSDMTHQYWSGYIGGNYPGTGSDYCYLKAGTYRIRVYPYYSGSGYLRVNGTAKATSIPVRNNDSSETATPLTNGKTTKGLFTRNDSGVAYYKFSISGTKTVRITCEENDKNVDAVSRYYLYNADKQNIDYWTVYSLKTTEHQLAAGDYYIMVERSSKQGGPYTIKYQALSDTVADATVALSPKSYTYNGQQRTPDVTVKLNGGTLRRDVDYTVAYSNGRADVGTYYVTVRGTGSYKGSKNVAFTINKASVAKAEVTGLGKWVYNGKAKRPSPTVKVGGRTLQKGTDYTVSYKNNVNVGTATVTITGKGNYKGTRSVTFKIVKDTASVQYFVHRQTYGNENPWSKANGAQSGTVGESKRLEGIWIRLNQQPVSGSIQYRTHIQRNGWENGWRSNGAMSGTSHESKRLEAIQIRLTGDMSRNYDVYYRVHAQQFGWMGWAKNGASAGTAGYSYRLEAIQIVLVRKGGGAPASYFKGAYQQTSAAYRKR
ncbi:MAG: hypothetical protein IKG21_09750, partial [Atopobiaceae bacterium]|nr:hypothetical protein [Atopobiaceae bacterium]